MCKVEDWFNLAFHPEKPSLFLSFAIPSISKNLMFFASALMALVKGGAKLVGLDVFLELF